MKTAFTLLAASGILAGVALLACGEDTGSAGTTPDADASVDSPSPDGSTPGDASDGATADAARDARPPFDAAAPDVTCAVTPCIKSIVAGDQNYCATASDGVVRCWGNPTPLGDFVDGSQSNAGATPVVLSGFDTIVDVGVAANKICVVTGAGKVHCFGQFSTAPVIVDDVDDAKRVFAGDDRSCTIRASGDVWCWGDSYVFGNGAAALELGGNKAVSASIRSYGAAFALAENGALFSWGSSGYPLGRNTAVSPDLTPAPVIDLPPVLQFAASNAHACALAKDGRLYCWGRADNGALGLGYYRHEELPIEVFFPGPAWPAQLSAAQSHSCARMTDGTLTCWSRYNGYGQLGLAALEGVYTPTPVEGLAKTVVSVAVADGSTCALLVDGSVQCWGDNGMGQLGQGTRDTNRHPSPVTVAFP